MKRFIPFVSSVICTVVVLLLVVACGAATTTNDGPVVVESPVMAATEALPVSPTPVEAVPAFADTPVADPTATAAEVEVSAAEGWEVPPVLAVLAQSGGYSTIEFLWSRLPELVLYADGRIITARIDESRTDTFAYLLHEGQLPPADLCSFLLEFEGNGFLAFDPNEYEEPINLADASTTTIIVNASRRQKVEAYGLDVLAVLVWESENGNAEALPPPLLEAYNFAEAVPAPLLEAYNFLKGYEISNAHPYQPERLALMLMEMPDATDALEWPLEEPTLATLASQASQASNQQQVTLLEGEAALRLHEFFNGELSKLFTDGKLSYFITARPLLPLESWDANDSWPKTTFYPETPSTSLSCP
jgi:hypothetical protein